MGNETDATPINDKPNTDAPDSRLLYPDEYPRANLRLYLSILAKHWIYTCLVILLPNILMKLNQTSLIISISVTQVE